MVGETFDQIEKNGDAVRSRCSETIRERGGEKQRDAVDVVSP